MEEIRSRFCPDCGKPHRPDAKVRKDGRCKECAKARRLVKQIEKGEFVEGEAVDTVKKTKRSTPKPPPHPEDNSVQYALKRFFPHLSVALVLLAVFGALTYLISALLAKWSGAENTVLPPELALTPPCVIMVIFGLFGGAGMGIFGVTLSNIHGFVDEKKVEKIKKVRVTPLTRLFWIHLALCACSVVGFIFSRKAFYEGWNWTVGETELTPLVPAICLGGAVYFLFIRCFSWIPLSLSECDKCYHFDCKVPTFVSDEKRSEITETKDEYVYESGTSVTVDGTTVATIGGGWHTQTRSRTVKKREWLQHTRCKWCGKRYSVKREETEFGKWN